MSLLCSHQLSHAGIPETRSVTSPEPDVLSCSARLDRCVLADNTQGLQSSSFLGVPFFLVRDSNILPQKELLWSLRVLTVRAMIRIIARRMNPC